MTRITPDDCRKIDPSLSDVSDEDSGEVVETLYGLAGLGLVSYFESKK